MAFLGNFIVVWALLSSVSVFAANGFEPYTDSLTWESSNLLPQYSEWQYMYDEAKEIADDLSNSRGKYSLIYKQKGGSSHQTLVIRNADQKTMGIWSAPNHATYIDTEIFEFNVARLLNRSQWATPATRVTLTGAGREQAKAAMEAQAPAARSCNRSHILNYLNANPHYIVGVYKSFEPNVKPVDIPELVDRVDQKRLNPNHPLVKMLNHNSNKPTGEKMYLGTSTISYSESGATAESTDTELAKQLSFMALVDALTSQRDRFGPYGSNMQVMFNKTAKTFKISLIDNGGGADSAFAASLKYFVGSPNRPGVSRFESEVLKNVLALDDFLKGKTSSYQNYHSIDELKTAIGYESYPSTMGHVPAPPCDNFMYLYGPWKKRWDIRWTSFVKAVDVVSTHMRKYEGDSQALFD